MESFVDNLLALVAQYPKSLAFAVFLTAFAESLAVAGILVPGVVLLFGLAALAGGGALSIEWTLFAAFSGAVCGDICSFYLGKRYSLGIKNIWPLSKTPELVFRAEAFFQRHGGKSVVIGRFVGPIRPIIPALAGAFGMPDRRFIGINLLSAVLWAPWYILPGYLFGAAINLKVKLPPHFYLTLLILIFCIALVTATIMQVHWQFRPNGWLYRKCIQYLEQRSVLRHKILNLSSRRDFGIEYPINSFLLFVLSLLGFLLLSLLVLNISELRALDLQVSERISGLYIYILSTFFVAMTLLGDTLFLYLLFGFFILLLLLQGRLQIAVIYVLAGLSMHGLTTVLKDFFAIARPDNPYLPASFAFPSGHTSGSVLVIGLIAAALAREHVPHLRWKFYLVASLITLLIGCSRIYLGVHWTSDVIGGLLLGGAICGFTRLLVSPLDRKPTWQKHWWKVLAGGTAIIIAFYQMIYLNGALLIFSQNFLS